MTASVVIDYVTPTANLIKDKECYILDIVMGDGNKVMLHFHSIEDVHSFARIMNLVVDNANERHSIVQEVLPKPSS